MNSYNGDYETRGSAIKKHRRSKTALIFGLILVLLQFIASAVFVGLLIYVNALPFLYTIGIIAVLVILLLIMLGTQFSRKSHLIGKILALLITLILCFGCYYLSVLSGALTKISKGDTQTVNMSVIVLNQDPAKSLNDTVGYNFGIVQSIDRANTDKALNNIEALIHADVSYTEITDYPTLVQTLLDGNVQAIIFNEANRSQIEDTYSSFSTDTRVLTTFTFTTEISSNTSNIDVVQDSYVVYLSGNDQTGEIGSTGRTDVNICAVINPQTKTALLVSTPRDAYIPVYDPSGSVPQGSMDKLTHTGNFGVNTTMDTIGHLYDTSVEFYVMLNFTGFQEIVDALGGITIYNETEFTAVDGGYYPVGELTLNGTEALNYARERHAFAEGDLQRNKNQTKVLKAILSKMMSPSLLGNYSQLMSGLSNAFRTNLSTSDMGTLVKMQLNTNSDWNVLSFNVGGTASQDYVYSMPSVLSDTVVLDENNVNTASALIKNVMNGKEYTQEEVDQLKANGGASDN